MAHKTFHSYTVRKGQGGSQSAADGRSGTVHPRSSGASLRRYNEQTHVSVSVGRKRCSCIVVAMGTRK